MDAEKEAVNCPQPESMEKFTNLKNILLLKNTSINYNQYIFMFTRQTSVGIKCYDSKHYSPNSKRKL